MFAGLMLEIYSFIDLRQAGLHHIMMLLNDWFWLAANYFSVNILANAKSMRPIHTKDDNYNNNYELLMII